MTETVIYILRLKGGNYYVGKTSDIASRYQAHLDGTASAWTSLHYPLLLERTIPVTSPFDEDNITKEQMARHGIDKVRGGSYCQEILSSAQLATLQAELHTALGTCYTCGKSGHYAAGCSSTKKKIPSAVTKKLAGSEECYRCGHRGHYVSDCYATRDIDGITIDSDDEEDEEDEFYSDEEYD